MLNKGQRRLASIFARIEGVLSELDKGRQEVLKQLDDNDDKILDMRDKVRLIQDANEELRLADRKAQALHVKLAALLEE